MNIDSFHNNLDAADRSYQSFQGGEWGIYNGPIFSTVDRGLSYQFFPHFHPYVKTLSEKLVNSGISSLLGMDIQFVPNPTMDGSIQAIANSTRMVLYLPSGQLSDSNGNAVYSGAPLTLADETVVSLSNGTALLDPQGNSYTLANPGTTSFTLPGFIPAGGANGIQVT
ncbi:MAG TPA: insecticidal toxin protein, partial [bacterium]|nr:insecticidal toxin protein [bacterium]